VNSSAPTSPAWRSSELIHLTSADARRMEAAEEYGALRYAQAVQPEHPDWGVTWEPFGGGHLVFVARTAPVGRAHGLGFAGKVTTQDIEHVEDFYFRHEADAQVDVCPFADPSLFQSLNERRFQVAEFNQTLARWITPEERFTPRQGDVEIRRVKPEETAAWSKLLAQVFFAEQAPQFEDFAQPWISHQHAISLAALIDGQMVGGATGLIVPEYRMAGLFGAATLPHFRGRGIQTALLQERLRFAQHAKCDLAVTLTMPGTSSQRNAEKLGFRTAYTKVVVVKRHPKGPEPLQVHYSE
jgi:GNAT superfamily N-acetyltransferase